ncbi:Phytocyanin domain containing protein [Trema orientale]|uniref:Phytocyanin domain containing protein n=1 Tax=Trema orientale TaxID=63057 RepID=A0A2P5F0M1_TREOI|nr:Phytocyanin domain containing protein [Trema orientale]
MGGVLKMVVFGLVFAAVSLGGKWAGAQMHHVVGGDRGWDASHDVASWASGKTFRVGDKIWFAYSAVQGSVAELGSRKEYEACDVSNPIRMYMDGLDSISLEAEGLRYFVSSNAEHCKNGLKLHVEVLPYNYSGPGILQVTETDEHQTVLAAGPTPSGSAQLSSSLLLFAFGFLCVLMTS